MKILITGGAGYIGSHVNKLLSANGHEVVVLDNLSKGFEKLVKWGKFVKGNVEDLQLVDMLFHEEKFDLVVHCAAFIEVGESAKNPEKYYKNNFANTVGLLEIMKKYQVKKMLFCSTAAVYGDPAYLPIDELHPKSPVSPYGHSKLMVEQALFDANAAWGLNYTVFRFFNVCGASADSSVGQLYEPATHLMAACFETIVGKRPEMKLFGTDWETRDGTCIRDYIHVEDLASAHLLAIKYMENIEKSDIFNLGSGQGYTVREVIDSVKRVTGVDFKVSEVERRAGDAVSLIASSQKAKDVLGWSPTWTDLDKIVESGWKWFSANYSVK